MNIRTMFRVLPLMALLSANALAAPVTINFGSSLISRSPGQTASFSAILSNMSGALVFLNSDSLNIAAPLTPNDTNFFLFAPLTLGPGASSGSFPIFDILVPLSTPYGTYSGLFVLFGGSSGASFDQLGSAVFAVNVVPEPATGSLILLALCAGAAMLRKRS